MKKIVKLRFIKNLWGLIALVISIALAIVSAFNVADNQFLSVTSVIASTIVQALSGFLFSTRDIASKELVSVAMRRLFTSLSRAKEARIKLENTDGATSPQIRDLLGRTSVVVSYLEEDLLHAAKDWAEFSLEAKKIMDKTVEEEQ